MKKLILFTAFLFALCASASADWTKEILKPDAKKFAHDHLRAKHVVKVESSNSEAVTYINVWINEVYYDVEFETQFNAAVYLRSLTVTVKLRGLPQTVVGVYYVQPGVTALASGICNVGFLYPSPGTYIQWHEAHLSPYYN